MSAVGENAPTATIASVTDRLIAENPFPGLRPFEYRDSEVFFGRDRQIEDVRARLSNNNFLAVIGVSGSGKSSLIRAGVIPILYQGFVDKSGTRWKIALMRPGKAPIKHLAQELDRADVLGPEPSSEELLNSGFRGLLAVGKKLDADENLLIVVDQFEEIFRYKDLSDASQQDSPAQAITQADAFVGLLLNGLKDERIYVIITMRSDFLGDCARFPLLAEHINRGQYLIPALSPHEQRPTDGNQESMPSEQRQVIEFPIHAKGALITEPLISRLLGDLGSEPARLPVVQHALRQIWNEWAKRGNPAAPLDVSDYKAVGGCAEAMNKHAAAAYDALPSDEHKRVTKLLFQRITLGREDGKVPTRRPTELKDILAVVNANKQEDRRKILLEVIAHYSRDSVAFVAKPQGKAITEPRFADKPKDDSAPPDLSDESIIDITHESLCQQWTTLNNWVKEEVQSAWWYERITQSALLEQKIKQGLKKAPLSDAELDTVLNLYLTDHDPLWTSAWSTRYNKHFQRVEEFIDYSKKECQNRKDDRERQEQRDRDAALKQERDALELEATRVRAKQVQLDALKLVEEAKLRTQKAELEAAKQVEEARLQAHRARLELEQARLRAEHDELQAAKQRQQIAAAALRAKRQWIFFGACAVLSVVYFALLSYATRYYSVRSRRATVNTLIQRATVGPSSLAGDWTRQRRLAALAAYSLDPANPRFTNISWWERLSPRIAPVLMLQKSPERSSSSGSALSTQYSRLAVDPTGGSVAYATAERGLTLYHLGAVSRPTRDAAKKLNNGSTLALSFSSKGSYLAQAGGEKDPVWIYEVASGETKSRIDSGQKIYAIAFSPGENLIALAGRNTLSMYSVEGQQVFEGIKLNPPPVWMGFDPSGQNLVVALEDQTVHLYRFDFNGRIVTPLPNWWFLDQSLASVAFSYDNSLVAVGQQDGSVRFFDLKKFEEKKVVSLPFPASSMAFSRDGKELAIGTRDGSIMIYDTQGTSLNWQNNVLIQAQVRGPIYKVLFDDDSTYLAIATGPPNPQQEEGAVTIIDASGGQELTRLDYRSSVNEIAKVPGNPKSLVFASPDSSAGIMEIGQATAPFGGIKKTGKLGCKSSDASLPLNATASAALNLWVYNCGSKLFFEGSSETDSFFRDRTFSLKVAPSSLETDAAGDLVAWIGNDKRDSKDTLYVAEVPSNAEFPTPKKHKCGGTGSNIVFSPDGKRIACISNNGVAEFEFDRGKREELAFRPSPLVITKDMGRVSQIAYGRAGAWAVAGIDGDGNGRVRAAYQGSERTLSENFFREQVEVLTFAADSAVLAVVTGNRTFLYELSEGRQRVKKLSASGQMVWLSRDGSLVALGGGPGLRVYSVGDWSQPDVDPKLIAEVNVNGAIQAMTFNDKNGPAVTTLSFDSQSGIALQQSYPISPSTIAEDFCKSLGSEENYSDDQWRDANLVVNKWLLVFRPGPFCPTRH